MITTKNINAKIDKQRGKKLGYVTTKNISVKNLGDGKPLVASAGPLITTHNIEDAKALRTKKLRDEIMAERQADKKKKQDAKDRMAKARAAKGKGKK